MTVRVYLLIFILVLMIAVIIGASAFSYQQAKLAPLTLAGLILILSGIQLAREIRSGKETASESPAEAANAEPGESRRRYIIEGGWMVGFVAAIYVLGLLVAIPAYGISYMRTHGVKWSVSIIIAASMTVISWVLFSLVLGITFYPGLIYKYLLR